MYEAFFGLKEKPFNLTPNPHFLFLSESHSEVYAHLLYGVESRSGFIMVSGEVGTGKTTILRTLLKNLDPSVYRIALIFNPKLTATELLHSVAREFGIDSPASSLQGLLDSLNDYLLKENSQGRTPVLVIDEAQNLSGDVLEQIRLLSNLETETAKLIQIILVGQPELEQLLNDPSLRQLNQRIAVRYRLAPLNCQETRDYVLHRLKMAGRPDGNLFAKGVLLRLFKVSGGVPRMINLLCDRCLLSAFSDGRGLVLADDLARAHRELTGDRGRALPHWVSAVAVVALLMIGLCVWLFLNPLRPESTAEAVGRGSFATDGAQPRLDLTGEPGDGDSPFTVFSARNALLAAWGSQPVDRLEDDREAWRLRGFQILTVRASFDELMPLDLPFLVAAAAQNPLAGHAVLGRSGNGYRIIPEYAGHQTLGIAELRQLGSLDVLVPWLDYAGIGFVGGRQSSGEQVVRLQQLLKMAGWFEAQPDGLYASSSIEAVRAFQKDQGLEADGVVGPRTLVALYRAAGGYLLPSLKGPSQ